MIKTNYKQIIIISVLLVVIIAGIFIYLYQNHSTDYSFLEISESTVNSEVSNVLEEKIVIHIAGQVANPGIVELKDGARIVEAIEAAGGVTSDANLEKINLAYILEDGMKVYIPSIADEDENNYVTTGSSGVSSNSSNATQTLKININTASVDDFSKIPGIGSSIASRIVEYRKENGKFSTVEDIKNVSGIGDAKFNNIKSYIYVK